jgi:hypothetical protein
VSDSWDDIQASCAAFVEAVRERIAREPDMIPVGWVITIWVVVLVVTAAWFLLWP